jgi:hypothetical protein
VKNYYTILIALLLVNVTKAQTCLPNGIIFTRQSQIDNFPIIHPNCTQIGGNVEIEGNDITSPAGLNNIDAGSITSLTFYANSSLSTCAVLSICNYVANSNGFVAIMGNAPGCNSEQEVRDVCASV